MITETILYIECLTGNGSKVSAQIDRSSKDQRVTWKYTVIYTNQSRTQSRTHLNSRDEAIEIFNTMVRDLVAGAGK